MTTATLPRRFSLPAPGRPGGRAFVVGFVATVALGLFLLTALSIGIALGSEGKFLPHVSVGGVPIGGLSRGEATDRLRASLPSLSSGHVTITVNGEQARVEYGAIGRDYDFDAMLDAAFGVGRSGGALVEAIARLRTLVSEASVPVWVHPFDPPALERAAAEIAEQFTVAPIDASVSIDGEQIVVQAATIGQVVDADRVRAAIETIVSTSDPANASVPLRATSQPPAISTEHAEAIAEQARAMIAELPLVVGEGEAEESFPISAAEIRSWISFGPRRGAGYAVQLDEAGVTAAVEAVRERLDREPVNASFVFAGAGVGSVVGGTEGRALDVAATVDAVLDALQRRGDGDEVTKLPLVVDVTEPEITTAEAEAAFSQMTLLGSWTTYYVPEPGNHFGNNINIPAFDINGKVLAPGEWFSFWGSVGPITEERGFGYGGVIIGGRSVAGGAIGGGICSTSTTLFNAAMRAGLQIGIKANHYYYIPRYPTGLDATVYMDDSYVQDMTFRNDTAYPILIRGYGGVGFVTFEVYGVPDGRSVVLSDATTWNHGTAIETTQVSADLAPGTAKRVEYPHDGFDASVTRWVYDANGNVMHQDTWFSSYRVVNGLTLVGPSASAPAPPAETAEAPSDGTGEVPPEPAP